MVDSVRRCPAFTSSAGRDPVAELAPTDPAYVEVRRTEMEGGGTLLALHGELDLGSAPVLEAALSELQSVGADRLVIDLGGLSFMDSTGVAVMLRAQQAAQDYGQWLICRPGPRQVQRLLELTGAIDRFEFEGA